MLHQRTPRAILTARLSQRTHPETKTTVALKNINAMNEWMTIVIQRRRQRYVSAFHHIQITSKAQTAVKA
jgi:hypothetical protein